jgi:hypothetical protein
VPQYVVETVGSVSPAFIAFGQLQARDLQRELTVASEGNTVRERITIDP